MQRMTDTMIASTIDRTACGCYAGKVGEGEGGREGGREQPSHVTSVELGVHLVHEVLLDVMISDDRVLAPLEPFEFGVIALFP